MVNVVRLGISLIIVALLFIGVGASYKTGYNGVDERYPGTLHIETYIYKNGRLVLYDPDDPPVKQFLVHIARGLAGSVLFESRYDLYGTIFITNDNIQYSYTLSAIPANRWEAQITQVNYIDQNHAVEVSATITYDGSSPINITAYGLYINLHDKYGTTIYTDLVFYDVLDTPIQLNPGDSVTIVYKVSVP